MKLNEKPAGLVDGPYGEWVMKSSRSTHICLSSSPKMDAYTLNAMIEAFNSASHYSYDLGYGLTGLLWALQCMQYYSEEYENIIDKKTILPILEIECLRLIKAKNYDLFDGGHGIMVYLMEINSLSNEVYMMYIKSLMQNLKVSEIIPPSTSMMKNNKKLKGINLGVPHGVTGCVLMLTRLNEYETNQRCRELLERSVQYLVIKRRQRKKGAGTFSYSDHPESEIAPLAWCYGDLSTGYAILKAGKVIKNMEFIKIGISILESTLKRNDFAKKDLSLCHGAPCIAYIYHKAWLLTGYERYLKRSEFWVEITKKMIKEQQQNQNIANHSIKVFFKSQSLIYGYPGMHLALNTIDGRNSSKWDSWMLL